MIRSQGAVFTMRGSQAVEAAGSNEGVGRLQASLVAWPGRDWWGDPRRAACATEQRTGNRRRSYRSSQEPTHGESYINPCGQTRRATRQTSASLLPLPAHLHVKTVRVLNVQAIVRRSALQSATW